MKKPDITVTGAIGTNIVSASIPQKNVEGLEERFEKTEKALHSTINLTFEHGQKIDELNKQNVNRFAEIKDLENELTDVYWHIDQLYDKLYNQKGEQFTIVHQYDRDPHLKSQIKNLYK